MTNTYLSFMVCDELFAVNVSKVLEVLQKQRITHVPNAPDEIKAIADFVTDTNNNDGVHKAICKFIAL